MRFMEWVNKRLFLREGPRTKITPRIKEYASKASGEGLELVQSIIKLIKNIPSEKSDRSNRELSADDILKLNRICGCITAATLFRTLCLVHKIPAVYVECLNKGWLYSKPNFKDRRSLKTVKGHAFVDVFVGDTWYTIDVASPKPIHNYTDYSGLNTEYVVIKRGLDSAHVGFSKTGQFRKYVAKKYNKPYLIE